ncbi:MAG: ketol-acid reductoisomerase [Candidatus Hodarchaeales archaeon]|jgi:ketol-acid reductoisomerase
MEVKKKKQKSNDRDELATPIYFDKDIDCTLLKEKTIGIIGYGNQGRAQALNLKDNGYNVIIGNIDDDYKEKAKSEGFQVIDIPTATKISNILMILLPDEVQKAVFDEKILPFLSKNQCLCFASGFNITYLIIQPPEFCDIILVAPRMIGIGVRDSFVTNKGFYTFVAIEQDTTNDAKNHALAIAKGIGSTKPGGAILEVTFQQETELDLFTEQAFGPAFGQVLISAFTVALEAGYPPEAVFIELYMSGEFSYTLQKMVDVGIINQMKFHSPTSQYGSMSRGLRYMIPEIVDKMRESLREIREGSFAEEFNKIYTEEPELLEELWEMAQQTDINVLEAKIRKKLKK